MTLDEMLLHYEWQNIDHLENRRRLPKFGRYRFSMLVYDSYITLVQSYLDLLSKLVSLYFVEDLSDDIGGWVKLHAAFMGTRNYIKLLHDFISFNIFYFPVFSQLIQFLFDFSNLFWIFNLFASFHYKPGVVP